VYKRAWTQAEATDFICTNAGVFFEADVAKAFRSLIDDGEIDRITKMVEPLDDL
jgi:response regulator RpfG family c-di-GMP phosphodiesterase